MPIITLCSSAAFYRQLVDVHAQLEARGYTAILPYSARGMKQAGNYEVVKSWYTNPDDYDKKADLVRRHFDEIAKSDAILVANYEKHGQPNYIGPNVLMEMGLAFYLRKPIYILNELPEDSPFEEELKGFRPIILHGELEAFQFSHPTSEKKS